jgi:hypothetical protein
MTCLTTKSVAGLLAAGWVMVAPCAIAGSAEQPDGPVQVLTNLQFSSPAPVANSTTLNVPGWAFGSQSGGALSVSATTPPVAGDGSYALEANYPVTSAGGQYIWADYSVSALNTEDIYVDFWAKMPDAKGGCKFLKIFGKRNDPQGIAAVTLGANYTGSVKGGIANLEYGDGTTVQNSGQQTIFLNGAHPTWIGRSYGVADVLTPDVNGWPASNWGTSWHHFRVHVKFNSGTTTSNQVADGEYYVEIDGKAYVDATGLYNRNPANGPLDYVEFGGWAQTDPQAFDVWYDNIIISTGGFVSDSGPKPPGNVAANTVPN